MKRVSVLLLAVFFVLLPAAARAEHLPPNIIVPMGPPLDVPLVNHGEVRYIGNLQTGRSVAATFGENAPFERDGRKYMVAGSSVYGLSVLDVTDPLSPAIVSEYAAAFGCPDANVDALAAPHPRNVAVQGNQLATVPGTGKFGAFTPMGGFENDLAMTPDGKIAILGMDASGRCHDPIDGGLEFVDLTDVRNPRALHLTRNIGFAHSVTVDPTRPWLAYISNSDSGSSDRDSRDFIEIVDFSSCLGGVAKIAECKPSVGRAQFDVEHMPGLKIAGKTDVDKADDACHDIRFRGDRAYCAAIDSTLILDVSGVLGPDGKLTGTDLAAGPNGCKTVDATKAPGVKVTDCMNWTVKEFRDRGAKAINMRLVSVVTHDGDSPAHEDVQIAHQAEAIGDGTIMMITDERGGGLANENGCPGGGVWFYDIRDETKPVLMRQPDGRPGVYITQINAPPPIEFSPSCTVHYGQEFEDENLLAFGWYMNGTRVVRYTPDFTKTPAQIAFEEVAAYIPPAANTIHAMGMLRNPADTSEIVVYAGDADRGVDLLGVRADRVTRKQAFKFPGKAGSAPPKPRVLPQRVLPNTGIGDPTTLGLALTSIAVAAGLRRRPRRR